MLEFFIINIFNVTRVLKKNHEGTVWHGIYIGTVLPPKTESMWGKNLTYIWIARCVTEGNFFVLNAGTETRRQPSPELVTTLESGDLE